MKETVKQVEKRPALGKGLSALIPEAPRTPGGGVVEVDIDALSANSQQPRLQMDDAKLEDLARSIKANGIIQPILVRRVDDNYRIIAGERRWRAARKAGLTKVPVVIRDAVPGGDKELLELALIENLQRENLNPIDEAIAYQKLSDEHGLTQEEVAAAVGKDRSSVANYMRLLKLDEEVRAHVASGQLTMGHARALLGIEDRSGQRRLASDVLSRGLSVRQTESLVKRGTSSHETKSPRPQIENDVHTRAAEDRLRFALGTRVRIARRSEGGTIEIDFASESELNRIYEQLTESR
jgi:ParB family chromosome partitioning protein